MLKRKCYILNIDSGNSYYTNGSICLQNISFILIRFVLGNLILVASIDGSQFIDKFLKLSLQSDDVYAAPAKNVMGLYQQLDTIMKNKVTRNNVV